MAKKKETLPVVPETLWQMCVELQTIQEKILEQHGELQEGDLEALQSWNASVEAKAENVALFREHNKSRIAYFRAIEDAAAARRKACEATDKSISRYLASCMSAAGVKKVKRDDGLFTISLVAGRASVRIENEDKLPLDLVEVVTVSKPNTKEIKSRLEAGEEIPGATLEYGDDYIMIRGGSNA